MNEKWVQISGRYEGLRLKPYTCPAGHLTIGYGHNLENGITPQMARFMLEQDLALAQMEVGARFAWSGRLDEVRQFVLVDMCFNMGLARLCTFKKMLCAVEGGDYQTAAKEMLESRWAKQVKSRAVKLAEMMKTGEYV